MVNNTIGLVMLKIIKYLNVIAVSVFLLSCTSTPDEKRKQPEKTECKKAKIQKDLSILTDRLSKINESLSRKNQARNEYDKTIQETEAAYMKILESSQTLLHVLKRESVNLTKKQSSSQ